MPLLRSVESLRITPGPAEVGGGNNNQRSRVVVGGERKANAALAFENKVTGYNFFFSICIGLINERLVEPDLAALYRDDQITAWIDVWHEMVVGHCRDVKHDCVWVRARPYHKVILELPLIAVINQIHAGISVFVFHLGVGRHIVSPFLWIIADKIGSLARQLLERGDFRFPTGPYQRHADSYALGRGCAWRSINWCTQNGFAAGPLLVCNENTSSFPVKRRS